MLVAELTEAELTYLELTAKHAPNELAHEAVALQVSRLIRMYREKADKPSTEEFETQIEDLQWEVENKEEEIRDLTDQLEDTQNELAALEGKLDDLQSAA